MWTFHPTHSSAYRALSTRPTNSLSVECTMKLIHYPLCKLTLFWLNPVNLRPFWPTCIFTVEAPLGPSCYLACLVVHDLDENHIVGLGSKCCTMAGSTFCKVPWTRIRSGWEERVVERIASANKGFVLHARESLKVCFSDRRGMPWISRFKSWR